jgi:hypothetical protein
MERVAADIEGVHLGIANLDAFLAGALVENAFDLESPNARSPGNPPESIRRTRLTRNSIRLFLRVALA